MIFPLLYFDCKQLLVGLLQTVEKLISDGFNPQRTVLLAFGHDEESGGMGAVAINETLTGRYGHDSIYAVVDEGSTIIKVDGDWYALPVTGEKGRINMDISVSTPGGHSSIPPDHTTIGIVSQLVNLIEANQFKPAEFDPKANEKVVEWISSDITQKYLIQTSQAIDIIQGGVKSNALPEYVSIVYNTRIGVESKIQATVDHILDKVRTIAQKLELGLCLKDEVIIEPTPEGFFKIQFEDAMEALPVTPSAGSV